MAPFCQPKAPSGKMQINGTRIVEALIIVGLTIAGTAVVNTKLLGKDVQQIKENAVRQEKHIEKEMEKIDTRFTKIERILFVPAIPKQPTP